MKWFMAANSESLEDPAFMRLVRVAAASARANTKLESFLMLDGAASVECDAIQALGVTVLPVKLSIEKELTSWMRQEGYSDEGIRCRRGSYLRMELPRTLQQHGIDDEFVMYTDADIFFMKDPDLSGFQPRVLAACGSKEGGLTRWNIGGHYHFQAGVLLMRNNEMLRTYEDFRTFVLANGNGIRRPASRFFQKHLFLSDQVALNLFYKDQISRMPRALNWNPASAPCDDPQIVHFNGMKWTDWRSFEKRQLSEKKQTKYERLIGKNVDSYRESCEHVLNFEQSIS